MKKKPAAGDTTSTARAVAHLDRLIEAKGKRIVTDYPAEAVAAIHKLLAEGYAANQSDVLRRAVIEAASNKMKRKC